MQTVLNVFLPLDAIKCPKQCCQTFLRFPSCIRRGEEIFINKNTFLQDYFRFLFRPVSSRDDEYANGIIRTFFSFLFFSSPHRKTSIYGDVQTRMVLCRNNLSYRSSAAMTFITFTPPPPMFDSRVSSSMINFVCM